MHMPLKNLSRFLKLFMLFGLLVSDIRVLASCYNKRMIRQGLTCAEKQFIIDYHNQLRQSVALGQVHGQPAASDMMILSWDDELAYKAQNLANTCQYGHDSSASRSVTRFYVGQNIATTWSTWIKSNEADFYTQIKAWFDEVFSYRFNSGFSHETGHYSQMVWGNTYSIGCGFSYYYDGYRYQKFYVCNYGPGGNVRGRPPYYPGFPGQCRGMFPSSTYYGLCDSCEKRVIPDQRCYYK